MRFDGKVVLVTGAALGIVRATSLKFASEGAKFVLCDVKVESLSAISEELKE
ncbi:MAG: SDR family NAD(P)-dependent oxidoreductase, partial [Clostridium sp.]